MERGGKKWTVGKYAKNINEWQTLVKDQPMVSAEIVTRQAGKNCYKPQARENDELWKARGRRKLASGKYVKNFNQ